MIATIRKSILIGALALVPFIASPAFADNGGSATLGQTGTGATTINILGNGTFSLNLNLTTTVMSSGITYFYQTDANGSGLFQLTTRTSSGSPYPDYTTSDAMALNGSDAILQFSNDINGMNFAVNRWDLGATTTGGAATVGTGSYLLSTITFQALGAAPGTYHIYLDNRLSLAGANFTDYSLTSNMITINVIPEPSTYALLALSAIGFAVVVYRRRRAAVGC